MRPSRSPLTAVLGLMAILFAGLALVAPAAQAANTDIRINEVESNGGTPVDWIELVNIGSAPVDISGWILKDNDDTHHLAVAAGTVMAAGAHLAIDVDISGGFGLGAADSARIFLPDGTTLIDSDSWTSHAAITYGRCPDGTGSFVNTFASTKGAVNQCSATVTPNSAVKINELTSNAPDSVELYNTGASAVDLSNWVLKDSTDNNSYTFPAGSSIAPGGFRAINGEGVTGGFVFGLGNPDAVRLFDSTSTLVDSFSYTNHEAAGTSYGRCPDGTGAMGATFGITLGSANSCTPPAPDLSKLKINEVESNGGTPGDWVELINTGSTALDISGVKLKDNDDTHAFSVVPSGTTIAAGGYYIVEEAALGFGLGAPDSVRLYSTDGTTLLDSYSWTTHAPVTYGRCPNGTGSFTSNATSTKGAANDCSSPVKINEVESNGGVPVDWIELVNSGTVPVDISGWILKDNDDTHALAVPAGTTLAAGAHQAFDVDVSGGFGLGAADSARLFLPDGSTLVDSYSWTAHASTTYGRCPDATGSFTTTVSSTKGATNACPGDITGEPWPGGSSIATDDVSNFFGTNLSGLVYEGSGPTGVLWAVKNGPSTLYRLLDNGSGTRVPDALSGWGNGKALHYPNGSGDPDTEGVTITGAGSSAGVYVSTERDNNNNGVSKPEVLRFDPSGSATSMNANAEWNLTADLPTAAANSGLEGIAWVPDSYLTGHGFVDESTGSAYVPGNYPDHGTGLFFVGLEQNGQVYAYALDQSGTTYHRVATINPGFVSIMDLNWEPETQTLWAVCDDTCGGQTARMAVNASGHFAVTHYYNRPAGMPNLNNEGFATTSQADCVAGLKPVFWSDDTGDDGHSLRTGTLNCTVPDQPQTVTITSSPGGPQVVGQSYGVTATGGASSNPVVLGIDPGSAGQCSLTGSTVSFNHTGLCRITANQDAGPGFLAGSTSQDVTVGKAATTTSLVVAPSTVTATVSVTAPGAATVGGSVDFTVDGILIGSVPVTGGTATLNQGVPNDLSHLVEATYVGNADLTGSSDSINTQKVTITSTPPASPVVGQTYVVTTTGGSSGNPVVLAVPGPAAAFCTLTGSTVTFTHPGVCTVTATEAATPGFLVGHDEQAITISKAPQTIAFAQPGNTVFGGADVPLSASSNAGLPVTLASTTPSVCTVVGQAAHPVGAGTCSITASQPGDSDHLAAVPVVRSLSVARAGLVVSTKSTSGLLSLLTLKIAYTTTVKSAVTGLPVAGVPVTTRINGGSPTSGCTATTNASGVATCTVGPIAIALGVSYTATAAETANYLGATGTAFIGLL